MGTMKAILFCALLAIGFAASAQDPKAVSLAQAEALREFPALGQSGSDFNKRFVQRFNSLKTAGDSLLQRDDWPDVLAKQIGIELGVVPVGTVTSSATPMPSATPTPDPVATAATTPPDVGQNALPDLNSQAEPKNICGYGKATWGMTVDEVSKAEPQAETPKESMNYTQYDGLLEIKNVDVRSIKFNVIFCFDKTDKKLVAVHFEGLQQQYPEINAESFTTIAQLLTGKYGAPTFTAENKASWKLPKTTIELTNDYMADVITEVFIVYEPTEAKNAESNNL